MTKIYDQREDLYAARKREERSESGGEAGCVPDWVAKEIRDTWKAAREAGNQMDAFRLFERMTDRLGYGRTENNPPLI